MIPELAFPVSTHKSQKPGQKAHRVEFFYVTKSIDSVLGLLDLPKKNTECPGMLEFQKNYL